MKQRCQLAFLACLSLSLYLGVSADNERTTYLKIYEKINGAFACFRRFNGTHQIGCGSKSLNGDTGVLHLVEDDESLNWVLKDGPHSPYVVVMGPKHFGRESMKKFQSNDRVAGVLLVDIANDTTKLANFTTEKTCPNRGFGFFTNKTGKDQQYCPAWNKNGSGMLYENWDFPVFYVNATKSQFILDCYNDFNKPVNGVAQEWPLCAAQLQSFMSGAVDTPTCMRRSGVFSITPGSTKVCDPLGSFNLHTPLLSVNQSTPYEEKSVIVIGARLDASSMFDELAPGADSAATGIVALLAALKHLAPLKEQLLESKKVENIYFVFFHGEAFDYIGSSRIVYDMAQGKFPRKIHVNSTSDPAILRLENIKHFIEIGQVASINDESYFLHQNWDTQESVLKDTAALVQNFKNAGKSFNLTVEDVPKSDMGLPPASFQSFLRLNPNLSGVVITNHKGTFRNPFYNSVYDTDKTLGYTYQDHSESSIQRKISNLAATIASTVLKIAEVDTTVKIQPDVETVDELLNCYIVTSKCKVFENVTSTDKGIHDLLQPKPLTLYVGVRVLSYQLLTVITRSVMVYYQGSTVNKTDKECKADEQNGIYDYYWINGSCFETTVNMTEAVSPAFIIENYDWKNANYSTWSESVWRTLQVRVFLKPSLQHELLTLCFGILLFVVSFILVGWANRKSDVIFSSSSSADAIIC